MASRLSPLAGQPAPVDSLVDVDALLAAYLAERPDPGSRPNASPSAPRAIAAAPSSVRSTNGTCWR